MKKIKHVVWVIESTDPLKSIKPDLCYEDDLAFYCTFDFYDVWLNMTSSRIKQALKTGTGKYLQKIKYWSFLKNKINDVSLTFVDFFLQKHELYCYIVCIAKDSVLI